MKVNFKHISGSNLDYAPPIMVVNGKVSHAKPIQKADFEFLKSSTSQTPKVTIPSPTMLHFRAGREGIPADVYPDMDEFFDDIGAAYRVEVASLADAGCRYLQLDDTNLAYLCDDTQRENAKKRGLDPDQAPRLDPYSITFAHRDGVDFDRLRVVGYATARRSSSADFCERSRCANVVD